MGTSKYSFLLVLWVYWLLPPLSDGQVMWDPAMDVAIQHYDNNHPRIAIDAKGNPLLIWGKGNDLMFSRRTESGFTTPLKLNPAGITVATAEWMGPDIASHGDTVYIVYKQTPENDNNSHIWCLHSFDGGITFSSPARVDFVADSLSRFPAVTTDPVGNPIIAFMKFNSAFLEARWVVTRSEDYGETFSTDVKASGWSSASSDVCDCCPGTISCVGNTVAMVYRDNNSNIRDNWAGISFDGGRTFSGGFNLDQKNWFLQSCPASGPDGVIIGDTLYSISMNGASGQYLVFFNKASLPDMTSPEAQSVIADNDGAIENYPRMANFGNAVAVLWRHNRNGAAQLGLLFTSNINSGLPAVYDTVAMNNVVNADVGMTKDKVYAIWQDDISGTVRFRQGTYETRVSTIDAFPSGSISLTPNPFDNELNISIGGFTRPVKFELTDMTGRIMKEEKILSNSDRWNIHVNAAGLNPGVYAVSVSDGKRQLIRLAVKY